MDSSVSIVGLSFRLPGAADLVSLWELFCSDREVVGNIPAGRFRADVSEADLLRMRAGGRPAAFLGAFLDDVESFDARYFGVPPSQARRMDPQQRLTLEASRRALADAGFDSGALRGSATGVFVGCSNHDYSLSLSRTPGDTDIFQVLGNSLAMIANRVSHQLDLWGPSLTVDTACSSGMVALHTAVESLKRGEVDAALVGGVNLITAPHLSIAFARAGMLAADGRCKAFSASADGYVRAEAVVFFVLMRAADARRHGHRVYADLLGSAVNQDGFTPVLTAPNVASQVAVMLAAQASAGVASDDLSYIEAHGTGTQVGDVAEYEALSAVLRTGSAGRSAPCIVGTAKAYLGHAEPASGLVGLLKTALSLRHEAIPRHRYVDRLNPAIREDGAFIVLPTQPTPWPRGGAPRIAGVSSFGFGGTNAHVIVREPAVATAPSRPVEPVVLVGKRFWKEARIEEPEPRRGETPGLLEVLDALSSELTQLLGDPSLPVDAHTPLATFGVDSLALFTLLQRIEVRYRVTIPLESVLQPGATLRSVAELVATTPPRTPAASSPPAGAFSSFAPRAPDAQPGEASPTDSSAVAAYESHTTGSKRYAQHSRAVLADNRNVAGFRPRTKEATYPIVAERAKGARIWDADGAERIDLTMGFGVHLFGHAPDFIHSAVVEALAKGAPVGPQSPVAGEVAALLATMTGLERFTFTNSGTEAVMLACRLARAGTRRQRIVVFEGAYHGSFDGILGFSEGELTRPITTGTPPAMVSDLVVLPWADPRSLAYIAEHGESLAAILVEPVQSRNPGVQPREFLHALRALATEAGAALIFDEVITGFRCATGGAQAFFEVRADLAVYGKVVGGGFPIGVVGGSARFLDRIDGGFWSFGDASAPSYDLVFFAGTFNKHPLAMAAARATLLRLRESGDALLSALNERTSALCAALNDGFVARGHPVRAVCFGSLFRLQSARNLDDFFFHLNGSGLYVWEGRTLFLSEAHTAEDLAAVEQRILGAADALTESFPASPPQRRFLGAPIGSLGGNVGFAVQLDASLDSVRLQSAVQTVLHRHEVFRSRLDRSTVRMTVGGALTVQFVVEASSGAATEVATRLRALASQAVDIERGPLATFLLIDGGRGGFTFAVATHGALLDGVSLGILFFEVASVYEGRSLGTASQYRDYLAFVGARAAAGGEGPEFWSALLPAGLPAPLFRMASAVRASGRVRREEGKAQLDTVISAARRAGVTLFVYLFSVFSVALARQSAGRPFAVAVPVADRRFPGGESVIGNLTVLTVVPQQVGPVETLQDVLLRNAALLPGCAEHAAGAWSALVGASRSRAPQVLFNLEPGFGLPAIGGTPTYEVDFPRPEATFVVSAHVLLGDGGLRVNFDFLEQVVGKSQVEALADAFVSGLA
ncbi:hypothetical protein LBMAG42_48050 [Deltaproteobacteria bacterium]|nr:hypothetical protein LBMAG42_48050 [Deltaproteobacteria bacterium]